MNKTIVTAFRILGQFWLEEVREDDLDTIAALPDLAETLSVVDDTILTDLAVEYQRLFGFNLPPYESVFVDPSAMLLAPATARVQALYRRAGWTAPADIRTGAPDHVGLELLALADLYAVSTDNPAQDLHCDHLGLWVPPFVAALRRLEPHPFYATLADRTLELVLTTLPAREEGAEHDPFPELPPPPVYRASGTEMPVQDDDDDSSLRSRVRTLLTPRDAGLYITRNDITRIASTLELAGVMGERERMLTMLFRLAGQYEVLPALHVELMQLIGREHDLYVEWADEYQSWEPYARAWRRRLTNTEEMLAPLALVRGEGV